MNKFISKNDYIKAIETPINFLEEAVLLAKEYGYYLRIFHPSLGIKASIEERFELRDKPTIVDLSALLLYPELDRLTIEEFPSIILEIKNINIIYELKKLTSLSIREKRMPTIDISRIANLQTFACNPCDKKHAVNINKAINLKSAKLWSYKGKDLTEFSGLEKLESLELMNPSICSLKGIEHMRALKNLTLLGTRKLEDVSLLEKSLDKLPNLTRVELPKKFEAEMQRINELLKQKRN